MRFPSLHTLSRRTVARTLALLTATALSAEAQTFGEALAARPIVDAFQNFISVTNAPFTAAAIGNTLASFSVLGGSASGSGGTNVGRSITPLLVSIPSGGSFNIVGVGTTRTVASGINSWDFGLVSGSATVGANVYFAWLTGGGGGAVLYTLGQGPTINFTDNQSVLSVPLSGASYSVFTSENRAYSIQWTVSAAAPEPPIPNVVPEPSTYALLVTGLAGVALLSRRRRGTRALLEQR